MKKFLALSISDVVFIMLINVKMPTVVGILTFKSRINFEHEKSFITSGSDLDQYCFQKGIKKNMHIVSTGSNTVIGNNRRILYEWLCSYHDFTH